MSVPQITIACVSSCAGFRDDCTERTIFYEGKWRKVGDRVHYLEGATGWRRFFRFPIVHISPEACGQIQLPRWYGWSHGWDELDDYKRRATIIGNTICPTSDTPDYLK